MLEGEVTNTVDFSKLRRFFSDREAEIYAGFPSGRMHIDAKHEYERKKSGGVKTDRYGNAKRKGGSAVTQETAELARTLYFGSAHIPARPFLTDGIRQNKQAIVNVIEQEAAKDSPNWDKVGTYAVGQISKFVRGDYYREHIPNSPETIVRKGSDKPLIDTADMINSLTYIVRQGGGK